MTGGSVKNLIAAAPARRRLLAIALLALAALVAAAGPLSSAPASAPGAEAATKPNPKGPKTQKGRESVVFVGNNWEGTADVLRFELPRAPGKNGRFIRLARLDIIPDRAERMQEIMLSPDKLVFFLAIRQFVGEGNDQFVDDMYSSNDGRLLVVSRPSFADVVGISLITGEIEWRFPMEGYRSDHMAVSPDGRHVAVSDSTANKVHILELETGIKAGEFLSGDSPHENTYFKDGSKIVHASIGRVYLPTDQPAFDTTKGERHFQVVNTADNSIISRVDMGQKLEEAGHPEMDAAVRPMALSPDERFVYLQVSFFHGFVEYDLEEERVLRLAHLPNEVPDMPREEYLLDSAHHGIAMNESGTDLCAAGTMSDYAAIVDRTNFEDFTQLHLGEKPYWSTTSDDGEHCLVSWSGTDAISAISYGERREVARIDVGDHPQRVRTGTIPDNWVPPTG